MITVIGVRFRTAGKIYYFDPAGRQIKTGDHVIVETARGIEYGYVVLGNREVDESKVVPPLKSVIRMATDEDEAAETRNKQKERDAFKICQEKIKKHHLEMKLIDAEYTFDNNKVLFYFTADGRIDFRELVKDLASVFKTRIELRQVGVRDETKIMGGIGICGRALCCHSYLSEFIPVSIKMAKEQNLSLNPTKISGVCGRLMCCLKNEEETYEVLNSKLPNPGDYVTTSDGLKGEVHSVNVLRQQVKVIVTVERDEKEIREYKVDQLKFKPVKHTWRQEGTIMLRDDERIDDLQRNHYGIIQRKGAFCFGMDAVLLSGFAVVKKGEKVLDLGTGTGIIPILLTAKTEGSHFTGLEIQEESADMARRSVAYNHLEGKVDIVTGDLVEASRLFALASFDVVTANPPYMNESHGLKNPGDAKAIARHEVKCTLEDVVREGTRVLKPGGRFCMVHRPRRLIEIITVMKRHGLEPKRMKMVHPYADREANMVLIEAVRGGGPLLKMEAPVIVFDQNGDYSREIRTTYGY